MMEMRYSVTCACLSGVRCVAVALHFVMDDLERITATAKPEYRKSGAPPERHLKYRCN